MVTLLCTHGHPSLHSWFPLLCTHGHPSLHSWSPFSALMVTLLCTHAHPSLHSCSPFSALMVTLLCTHGHPSLHSWSPFSALMVTLLCTYGHLLCTHGHPSLHSWSPSVRELMAGPWPFSDQFAKIQGFSQREGKMRMSSFFSHSSVIKHDVETPITLLESACIFCIIL